MSSVHTFLLTSRNTRTIFMDRGMRPLLRTWKRFKICGQIYSINFFLCPLEHSIHFDTYDFVLHWAATTWMMNEKFCAFCDFDWLAWLLFRYPKLHFVVRFTMNSLEENKFLFVSKCEGLCRVIKLTERNIIGTQILWRTKLKLWKTLGI